ncbi:MAG TPA: FtsW/RodA/SpoVE family cell cycle protein, partial [Baekduia sp.]|nr:FtsW/RodA/SpoVE family cell cycle protein [Baekduia sp.]
TMIVAGTFGIRCSSTSRGASATSRGRMRARYRELLALIPAALLIVIGFSAVFVARGDLTGGLSGTNEVSTISLTYGAMFLGLCIAAHVVLRFTLPDADPYLFPLVAVLACFGLVELYRIDVPLARQQAEWFVLGLVLFAGTIIAVRDIRRLERYRYVIVTAGLVALMLPRVPGIGAQTNGAYLAISVGPLTMQTAEFAKIAMVIFLASYLRETRQLLVTSGRRILGVFFGAFLAMLYVATSRASFVVVGGGLFAAGAWFVGTHVSHIQDRIHAWRDPFDPDLYNAVGGSQQLAQGLFAQADGGLTGRGFGNAVLDISAFVSGNCSSLINCSMLPAPHTDLIYAVIVNETGLVGAAGLIAIYLMIVQRGFKIAMLARDSFSKLLATGLTAVFALQVFVIVGGVTKVIPLTGVTLPFVSYGGSSVLANFVLIALLLLVSDRARRLGK